LLTPFDLWTKDKAHHLHVLVKVKGTCTTDHISPAGPWYKYRGHLENISNNMLLGALNALLPAAGEAIKSQDMISKTRDTTDGKIKMIPEAAKSMTSKGIKWCIIGETN
jgi:aconitate hydratase